MQQLNVLTQLRERADTASALEREVKELRAKLEKWEHCETYMLLHHLQAVCDTAPLVTLDGVVEWSEEDGRTPQKMDNAVLDALVYLDPRYDEPSARPQAPSLARTPDELCRSMIARARTLVNSGPNTKEMTLADRARRAMNAIQNWQQSRIVRMLDQREATHAKEAA